MREVNTLIMQKQYATETKIKKNVNGERSEATQEAGIMRGVSQTNCKLTPRDWCSPSLKQRYELASGI